MNMIIPDIKVPIIKNGNSHILSLKNKFKNKKIVLFGIPGAFTPTCSEEHFPGYIKLYEKIIKNGIDEIYCLSVNDKHVMKSWLISYSDEHKIYGIADGNADITKYFNLISDKTTNHMGFRSARFAMIIINNEVKVLKVENSGELKVSSAENILYYIKK